jgi:transmembrane sensor
MPLSEGPSSPVSPIDLRLMETANVWLLLEGEGRADPEALAAWLAASPAHLDAYSRAKTVYRAIDVPAARVAARQSRLALSRRQALLAGGVAAAGAWLLRDAPLRLTSSVTEVGETRAIDLPDGSRVELNTHSAASIDYAGDRRQVRLKRGEAWFEVARDRARPFVVIAGEARVTVLGTQFNVRRVDAGALVSVAEGRVEVRRGGVVVVLGPGDGVLTEAPGERLDRFSTSTTRVAEWREGSVTFRDATFGAVIDELGRYHRGALLIADDRLRERPISARLNVRAPETALQLAVKAASAEMIQLPGGARIIF